MRNSRQRATTLPELLVTLALLALLSTYAIPSFAKWISTNKQQVLREKLLNSLQMARTQAVLRAAPWSYADRRMPWTVTATGTKAGFYVLPPAKKSWPSNNYPKSTYLYAGKVPETRFTFAITAKRP